MKNSRSIVSQGLLFESNQSAGHRRSDLPTLKFTPLGSGCSHCHGCHGHADQAELRLDGLIAQDIGLSRLLGTTGVPVNITIESSRIAAILWNTLLLPLSGFVSGAAIVHTFSHIEAASIGGAVAGLILAVWCTRQIPCQAVSVEPVNDKNHGEDE